MLRNVKIYFLIAIIATICYKEVFTISYRDRMIGCLFSNVCAESQVCFDDNAFGRCEEVDQRTGSFSSAYVYELDRKTLQLLEQELDRLSEQAFSWSDPYSQCILKTILNDRPRIVYDSSICDHFLPSAPPGEPLSVQTSSPPTQGNTDEDVQSSSKVSVPNDESKDGNNRNEPVDSLKKSDIPLWNSELKALLMAKHLKRATFEEANSPSLKQLIDRLPALEDEEEEEQDSNEAIDEGRGKDSLVRYLKSMLVKEDEDSDLPLNSEAELVLPNLFEPENSLEDDGALQYYAERLNRKPEIRVLRDTDEELEPSELLANPPMVLVDVDLEDTIPNGEIEENTGSQDSDLLANVLDGLLARQDTPLVDQDQTEGLVGDIDNDDDDDDDRLKEILIDDVNYNNNYDTQMPNFYRMHRYDIKKPGPKYFEEYFLADSKPASEEVDKQVTKEAESKKDISIRSNKPVLEGPVKVDSKSENTLIIRSAESGEETSLEAIDSTHTYVITDRILGEEESQKFLQTLEQLFKLPRGTFSNLRKEGFQITFKVNPNYLELNASQIASKIEDLAKLIEDITGYNVKETGIGNKTKLPVVSAAIMKKSNEKLINITLLVCSAVLAFIASACVIFLYRRNANFREKVKGFAKTAEELTKLDYQELCRQRMGKKSATKSGDEKCWPNESDLEKAKTKPDSEKVDNGQSSPQSRSSTSSWVEEPVSSNMDITTGHIILSYMEDHLKKKDRLDREWEALCAYEADPCSTNAALQKQNANKNRNPDVLPYDHSRVILNDFANASNSDYINANTITDHDPRNPAYIVTQGPLAGTKADFWQMIWEQGSVIIVMLTRLRENGLSMCDRYWPEEGSEIYQNYEVHLVSEHIWCDDYLVRSFYLKNLKNGETRTVTQFHFLSWPENGIPPNTKSILDFRRKINKSYKGRSCPIVVHCSNGIGRTGTYILIDMVLNRLSKGAKEIDIAATLEHVRDQRIGMVKNKSQFEFVLLAVAEEVQAILKALATNN